MKIFKYKKPQTYNIYQHEVPENSEAVVIQRQYWTPLVFSGFREKKPITQ